MNTGRAVEVCAWCGHKLTASTRGRARVTCSDRCRQARSRWLRRVLAGVRWIRYDTPHTVTEQGVLPLHLLGFGDAA
jgi:endogenous inhibitor of DNA gyrase (YacG/DUF329 family)